MTLPDSWREVQLGDLVESLQYGFTAPADFRVSGPRLLRITDIEKGAVDWSHVPGCSLDREQLEKYRLRPDDIVFARTGSIEKAARIVNPPLAVFASYLIRGRPLIPELAAWLGLFVGSYSYVGQAKRMSAGIGRANVNAKNLARILLPLPPRAEQARIVDTVDSYLSRLDAAVSSLDAAQRKLKAYRASVLKAAVEGRLVSPEAELAGKEGRSYEPAAALFQRILKERRRRWEEAKLAKMKAAGKTPKDNSWKDKYSEPTLDERELPTLPEGWQWARLDQVSEVQLGQQRAPVHAAASRQLPYVRAANITWDGLDPGDVKTMGFPIPERYRLKFGDVLLSEASGSPMEAGKPAVWRDEIPGACYQKTLLRVRAFETDSLLPTYLRLVFLRDCVTGKFARLAPGVGIVHLTAERMLPWPVPVPPRAEQQRIVDEVERLETVQNSVRAAIACERARIVRLRQAVLTWAFGGRLVEQVPGDEPAEALLGRIRAERANNTPTTSKARRAGKLKAAS
jgi:type I restriction enzyme S subunit